MLCNEAIKISGITKEFHQFKTPIRSVYRLLANKSMDGADNFIAVSDVSFSVKKGERVGIVGANGAGKSTILQMIAGTINPSKGTVEVNGKVAALLELGAGFNLEFTGIENIYLYASLLGIDKTTIEKRIPYIKAFADIGDFIEKPVKTYSSGMFVRLAFSVAINVDPDILIVDEALSVGDYLFQSKCHRAFEQFQSKGGTVLFVSHDLTAVRNTCDRAILIDKGKMILDSTPDVVVNSYQELMKTNEITWLKSQSEIRSEYRFGEGGGIIDDVIVSSKGKYDVLDIEANSDISFKLIYELYDDFEHPVVTLTLRNASGIDVWGVNTKQMGLKLNGAKGKKEITISVPNFLAVGSYTINAGLVDFPENMPFIEHDHRWGMKLLTISGDTNCMGFINMKPSVHVDEGGK
ncbi:teichoic acid ABC transporter ATP-binding protein [Enterovibrio norvegicus FF-33]|uniref:ABC transporter ATP-binding protein n=1 Tax=Enterovibrio norvegicus TaxID=188144 RepID=UPI0002EDF841|nr:ABC transporter ATP-binding protein [Enterovibrio norvegicus]OEE68106.1 teichoic acid ABC transporter ATP-binding protein [Enterovibrio norvegicus FF-33]